MIYLKKVEGRKHEPRSTGANQVSGHSASQGRKKSTKQLSKSLPSRELLFVRGIKNMKKAFNILHQTENSY